MIVSTEIHLKGWGSEEWLYNSDLYCAKILKIDSGKKCSIHFHEIKTETMLVVSGRVLMRYGLELSRLEQAILEPGMVFHIEPGLLHQFEGLEASVIHEFSTQHFESDSIRVVKGD